MRKRIDTYSRGASNEQMMLMVWIFVLAGAFAHSARTMGAIDATVNLTLHLLPSQMLLAGLFVAACFISLSIGTSVGTIVALAPIATGIATQTDTSMQPGTTPLVDEVEAIRQRIAPYGFDLFEIGGCSPKAAKTKKLNFVLVQN